MKYKSWAFCSLCQSDVYYMDTMSTGMLLRHLRKHHREEYNNVLDAEVQKQKKPKLDTDQPKILGFVTYFPTFQKAYINWMVQTYQPISCCENSAFRTLCQSLNIKDHILGREKVRCLLTKEVLELRADVTTALKGMYFSATTDAWTANNNVNYSTCTVHFIDKKTWILHHFALGIFKKTGTSRAEDVVAYCQNIWQTNVTVTAPKKMRTAPLEKPRTIRLPFHPSPLLIHKMLHKHCTLPHCITH